MSDEVVWYHGTRRPFTRGGVLFPRSVHGKPGCQSVLVNPTADEPDWVYVTTDKELARMFAALAPGRGKMRLLTVQPLGDIEADPATFDGEDRESYRCKWARVLKVEIIDARALLDQLTSKIFPE